MKLCIFLLRLIFIAIVSNLLYYVYYLTIQSFDFKNFPHYLLVCIILTTEESFSSRAVTVWQTYAKKCDRVVFACNCSNFDKNKNYTDMPILQLNITEDYNKMDKKVLTTLNDAYSMYSEPYYWFLLVDDDTYVFADNARRFISKLKGSEPLTYGYNYKITVAQGYHSGGGGTLFTPESIKRIVASIRVGKCNESVGFGDIMLGLCSEKSNVTMGNSLDEFGRERFHPLTLKNHYLETDRFSLGFYSSNEAKFGKECCSEQSITFHYVSKEEMIEYSKINDESDLTVIYNKLQ